METSLPLFSGVILLFLTLEPSMASLGLLLSVASEPGQQHFTGRLEFQYCERPE